MKKNVEEENVATPFLLLALMIFLLLSISIISSCVLKGRTIHALHSMDIPPEKKVEILKELAK